MYHTRAWEETIFIWNSFLLSYPTKYGYLDLPKRPNTETKPKYRNETEIPKRTIKSIGKESNYIYDTGFCFDILSNWNAYVHKWDTMWLILKENYVIKRKDNKSFNSMYLFLMVRSGTSEASQ